MRFRHEVYDQCFETFYTGTAQCFAPAAATMRLEDTSCDMCRTAVHASVCSACRDFYLNLALESDGGTNADRLPGRPLVVVVEESDD